MNRLIYHGISAPKRFRPAKGARQRCQRLWYRRLGTGTTPRNPLMGARLVGRLNRTLRGHTFRLVLNRAAKLRPELR